MEAIATATATTLESVTGEVAQVGGKGFGYIRCEDGRRVWFHMSTIKGREHRDTTPLKEYLPAGSIVRAHIYPDEEHGNFKAALVEVVRSGR